MVPLDKVHGPLMLDIDSKFSTVIVKPLGIAFHAMGCIPRVFTYPGPHVMLIAEAAFHLADSIIFMSPWLGRGPRAGPAEQQT